MKYRTDNQSTGGSSGHLREDLLLDLLHNLLPKAERDMALSHLSVCSQCESEFQEMVSRRERLRAMAKLTTNAAGEIELQTRSGSDPVKCGEAASQPVSDQISRTWKGLLSILKRPRNQFGAALVVATAALLLVIWSQHEDADTASDLYWLPRSSQEMQFRSGSGDAIHEILADGLDAYAHRDLKSAIQHLESAQAMGHLETVRKVYLGSALAMSRRYGEAAELLNSVSSRSLPDPWGSEARWTLYIALKKSGRTSLADSLLNVLAAETGAIGDRARQLMQP
ncbi:MAG: hypothetical protein KJ970_20165 [Candidatus Eisenbacteria bacterium]|uniref:Zinc-finger domain-containing protein n=1 Tax=Eiseniibacteriota bacterium TaxID=2212470 RepID=A0A948S126_UNCEI|nr:hypothetical protein [Candidatus Eisenbacteria bacterium]MBU1950563.1 hypothetical protein [Candidatus Eisenbacteria bacterium]MBU2693239.1 hypothetical protein [Candidatus Eisenbacteria bacterium]